MSEPNWMPSEQEITDAVWLVEDKGPGAARKAVRALIAATVEKALAEQKQEWIAALKTASGEYKCHPDFAEMWAKAESDPTYWAEVLRSSRDAYSNQAARHKREVLEARIEEIGKGLHVLQSGGVASGTAHGPEFSAGHCVFCRNIGALRSELAALDGKGKS